MNNSGQSLVSSPNCVEVTLILERYGDLTLNKAIQVIFGFIYITIFVLGMLGNCSLLISIITRKSLHSAANFLVANLAISNILLCLTAVPFAPITLFLKKWFFGSFLCKLIPYSQGLSVLISSLGLAGVAMDRYRHIVQVNKVPWSVKQACLFIGFFWTISALVNLPLFLSQQVRTLYLNPNKTVRFCGEFCGEYSWNTLGLRKFYGTLMLMIQFLIPVLLLTFCYSRILQKVRREMIVAQMCLLTVTQQIAAAARKRHVMYILILMVVVFVLSWLPLSIVNILRDYGIDMGIIDDQLYFSQLVVHSIAMTSVIWNPILYFWMSKAHRRKIKRDIMNATRARRTSYAPQHSTLLKTNRKSSLHRQSLAMIPLSRHTRSYGRSPRQYSHHLMANGGPATCPESRRVSYSCLPPTPPMASLIESDMEDELL